MDSLQNHCKSLERIVWRRMVKSFPLFFFGGGGGWAKAVGVALEATWRLRKIVWDQIKGFF